MSFSDFLDNLLDFGRVQVPQITPLEPGELAQGAAADWALETAATNSLAQKSML